MNRRKKERGAILVLTTVGLVALFGGMALAIDIGYLYVVKNQLQNGADAAALAGAQGLAYDRDYTNEGAAKRLAVEYAGRNQAEGRPIELPYDQVTFPEPDMVRVFVSRNVQTFFGAILGLRQVNVTATAAARVVTLNGGSPPGAGGGWRPFAIPDQWANGFDRVLQNRPFDASKGDYYVSPYCGDCTNPYDYSAFEGIDLSTITGFAPGDPTGYIVPRDSNYFYMTPITLKLASINDVSSPSQYYPIDYPPNMKTGGGASEYREMIRSGWRGIVKVGDQIYTKTGNMQGPTSQGIRDLCSLDPGATVTRKNDGSIVVRSPIYPENESPRIVPVVMFDPRYPPSSGREAVTVTNFGAFFINCEQTHNEEVTGFFLPIRLSNGIALRPGRPVYGGAGGGGRMVTSVQLVQ